jgi:hypothetical protein
MGMDIWGIVSHRLTAKDAISLPETIDSWVEIQSLKSAQSSIASSSNLQARQKAEWRNVDPINEFSLSAIWQILDGSTPNTEKHYSCDTSIECFIGTIKVYKNTIAIIHSPEHKYGNIRHPETAIRMIKINRKIAEQFGSKEVLYCPDGYYPTEILSEYAMTGKSLKEIFELGIQKFGEPPNGIEEGRKNMFFIDKIDEEIGEISEWDDDSDYWKYNEQTREYVQRKNASNIGYPPAGTSA